MTATGHLSVAGAVKAYGALRALDGVALEVREAEFVSLLGPSGCGKTTLLRALAGLVRLDDGRVVLDGRDITRLATHQRRIGFVFQSYALFPHMTVGENVAFGLKVRGLAQKDIERAVGEALETVRLPQLRDRMPAALSGGQQQRVSVARALVTEPRLLLLDEPFSALDRQLREQMQLELRDLTRRLRITTIFVTHDQDEALVMSDRVAVMNAGGIDQIGTPSEIYERPMSKFVLDFVGLSNYMEGRIVDRANAGCLVQVGADHYRAGVTRAGLDGPIGYAVRPEKITLRPSASPDSPNRIAGKVCDVVYLGGITHFHVDVGFERRFLAHVVNRVESYCPPVGADVVLEWRPEDAIVLQRNAS
jgi:putative spermidine/putrescine transport system ATP-binding protein